MKTIVILNLKGGVAKTTTATNLAYELSNIGETLLIDADKQGNSTEFYNIHNFAHGLGDVLTTKTAADACALHAALPALHASGKPYPHLRILPSDYRLMKSNISLLLDTSSGRDKRLRRYLAENEGVLEFVVVDCAPDIDMASINALMAADLAIVPITLDKNARKGLAEVWEQIEAAQQENPKLKAYALITRFRPDQKEKMIFDKYPAGQQDEAHRLAAAIKVNVKHPRRPSVATLLRQFDLNISEKTFRRYKREYCYTLALEAGLIPDASPKR